jgi:ribonucleotide reductase alpha subunit
MTKYSREEVKKTTLEYFKGDELATDVWINKYCLKDSEDNLYELTPDDMHKRLAKEFYEIEKNYIIKNDDKKSLSEYGKNRIQLTYDKIYEYFKEFDYVIPQGSVMSILGNPFTIGSLSNCVVIPELYDSYGGIMYADQQLVQLFKRRCVEENSKIITLEKDIISIKDVEIGMHVLSFNINNKQSEFKKVINKFNTDVDKDDRISISFINGIILNTSKKHPILTLNEDYNYKQISELKEKDVCIKIEKRFFNNIDDFDYELKDIGWFIGNHMGDGTCGLCGKNTIRFRNLGNEENTIKKYTDILNSLIDTNYDYKISTLKNYKSKVWEVSFCNKKLFNIIEKYFDNQIGKKTYNGFIPSFIKNNNLFIPFIAGLIDSDGYIRNGNKIQLSMCMKDLMEDISLFLNKYGIRHHFTKIIPKKLNEKAIYRIIIYCTEIEFINKIKKYMYNINKIKKLNEQINSNRPLSPKIYLTINEQKDIFDLYNEKLINLKLNKIEYENIRGVIRILKKYKTLGIAGLNRLKENDLLEEQKYNEILQRIYVKKINQDLISEKYIDIEVEDNNNFYAGNFGFINIHNCGVGLDISSLRPKNTSVSNAAKTTTGAISFMERFSNTTREVAQNARRGALMISINVKHPDIEDFIIIKNDLNKVTGANISVKITDDFMNAVIKNENFTLRFPVESSIEDAKYTKEINAVELWNKLIKSATNFAEPGIIMWDKQHWYSTSSIYPNWKNISTNPCCFHKEKNVFVITNNGIKEIKEITSNDFIWVDDKKEWVKNSGYFNAGIHKTYKVTFNNNEELFITDNHKLPKVNDARGSVNFELKELKDLKINDKIKLHINNVDNFKWSSKGTYEEGLILGWLTGDGLLSYKSKDDEFPTMYLSFWKDEHDICEKYEKIVNEIDIKSKITSYNLNRNEVKRIASSILTRYFSDKYEMNLWDFKNDNNDILFNFSESFIKGYLAAYFTADGTVSNNISGSSRYCIQLASININVLKQVKYLLNLWGIKSSVGLLRKSGISVIRGHEYNTQNCYRLSITGKENLINFIQNIGFLSNKKINISNLVLENLNLFKTKKNQCEYSRIKSIEFYDENEVGCITLEKYNYFTANGLLVGNSEIAMNNDSCRLIAINYLSFVEDQFTKNAKFNYDKLYEVSYESQRLMDDLVDLELIAVEKILEKIKNDEEPDFIKQVEIDTWKSLYENGKNGRRTGLGFTALGDTLAALGLKYGSDESIEFIDKISKIKLQGEFDSSIDMAIERGKFKDFDVDIENTSHFVNMLEKEFPLLYNRMMKYGRRNISISTIAPTGSLSILTQTTSGIEPLFQIGYKRRKKINPNDKNIKIDYVDQIGDSWEEYEVFHTRVKQWMDVNNIKDTNIAYTESPYANATANDIDWMKRIKIQSVLQKYVTHSISSTLNLPSDVSIEKVSEIYIEAWKQGLKGVTVYRDGSRSGVLVSNKEKKKEEEKSNRIHNAPKRPKSLDADIIRFNNNNEKWIAFVGILDDYPFEIFTGLAEDILIPQYVIKGKMIKNKIEGVSRYDFVYEDKYGYKTTIEGMNRVFNKEYHNYSKLISATIRHGIPIDNLVDLIESLTLDSDLINSWKKGVERALKRYIVDGKTSSKKCPDCGQETLVYENGCVTCKNCGSSKCN